MQTQPGAFDLTPQIAQRFPNPAPALTREAPLPAGATTFDYVSPIIAKRFPHETPAPAGVLPLDGVDTLTHVTPAINARFPAKSA